METCEKLYTSARAALSGAAIGQGMRQKLSTKVENAWRMSRSAQRNGQKNALHQLETALRLLETPPARALPQPVREDLIAKIRAFRDCIASHGPVATATLTVRTYEVSYTAPDLRGAPAGAGTILLVDGEESGITGADGSVTLTVPAREITVIARRYPSSLGEAKLTLAPREKRQLDLVLVDGKEIAEDTALGLDEAPEGVLPLGFAALTLRVLRDDSTVALRRIFQIEILHPEGGPSTDLRSRFALREDGVITATDVAGLRNVFSAWTGAIDLLVHAVDHQERTHHTIARFYAGRYRVAGRLVAPPSLPRLGTAGLAVTGRILHSDLVFHAVTDATGAFELPSLPQGALSFGAETQQDGKFFYGRGVITVRESVSLAVTLRHVSDLRAGVPAFTTVPLPTALAEAEAEAIAPGEARVAPSAPLQEAAEPFEYDVFVISGAESDERSAHQAKTIAKGTKRLYLNYLVQSDEYPTFVLAQSVFNDVWSVKVLDEGSGQMLSEIGPVQINSQLFGPPIWQPDGSTGEIVEVLNVEQLTAEADRQITILVTAMNVGDALYPTRVWGRLDDKPEVKIVEMLPNSQSTTGDDRYFSIPRAGATNEFERFYYVKFTKPETAEIENVKVELLGPGLLMTIVDEGLGSNIELVKDDILKVRVTMHDIPSELSGVPPETHGIKYKLTLTCTLEDGTSESDTKESEHLVALWRMPDGFARFPPGPRDPGGDDWCSRGAYMWLQANRGLMTAINDISGEHALNIGHETHAHGTDIDMYHFYRYDGAESGGQTYDGLAADILAIPGDPAARARVTQWIIATRAGIDALVALPTVSAIYYIWGPKLGGPTVRVDEGWGWSLLTSGKVTIDGIEHTLLGSAWFQVKYIPRSDHNDHVHLILNRGLLDG